MAGMTAPCAVSVKALGDCIENSGKKQTCYGACGLYSSRLLLAILISRLGGLAILRKESRETRRRID
jgi:hypothetical protein